ncbi:uncharacterized protein V1516DRAFT_654396 [Lipomyces oligophaga]|uniref:uncharacterized protein n=1 Tax=Lipomyces oligophaga TaxID=45792 RepID=UPI0034CFA5E3
MSSALAIRSMRFAARSQASVFRAGSISSFVAKATYSTKNEPKASATSLIARLPDTILSKTGLLATGTAAAVYAISNELYILGDETTLLAIFSSFIFMVGKLGGPAYTDWANGYIANMTSILNKSRETHASAVKERIDSVGQLKEVVDTTKILFEVSKETVKAEAEAFELKQKVEIAAEAKSVLDSWVRYEASVRQREQKHLTDTIIAKIQESIKTKKVQADAITQGVAEIEKIFASAK